jgi:putative aldouronate transport system substrate-binding protein
MVDKLQEFYALNYINPQIAIDAVSGSTVQEAWNAGNYLITTRNITPGYDADMSAARGIEVRSEIISMGIGPANGQGAGHAISVFSKNQKESVQLLNALYTDRVLQTIFCYGVEDIHWTDNGNGTLTRTERGIAEFNPWAAGVASIYTMVPQAVNGPYFADLYQEFNNQGVPISSNSFGFSSERVANQIAALQNIRVEYNMNVFSGAADEFTINAYIKAMNDNGIQEVLRDFNRQLQAYYRAKDEAAAAAAAAATEAEATE